MAVRRITLRWLSRNKLPCITLLTLGPQSIRDDQISFYKNNKGNTWKTYFISIRIVTWNSVHPVYYTLCSYALRPRPLSRWWIFFFSSSLPLTITFKNDPDYNDGVILLILFYLTKQSRALENKYNTTLHTLQFYRVRNNIIHFWFLFLIKTNPMW